MSSGALKMLASKIASAVAPPLVATGAAAYINSVSHQTESALVPVSKGIT